MDERDRLVDKSFQITREMCVAGADWIEEWEKGADYRLETPAKQVFQKMLEVAEQYRAKGN